MSTRLLKTLWFKTLWFLALLFGFGASHAQQPGVDCAPIQGQGWSGCAPINPSQQSAQGQQLQIPQQLPEFWQDHWGAIATDADKGIVGTVTNVSNGDKAEAAALADCQSKGGSACKIQLSYRNQCAAMVIGKRGHVFNINPGPTIEQAVQIATGVCSKAANDCHVYYSACSLPQRIQ